MLDDPSFTLSLPADRQEILFSTHTAGLAGAPHTRFPSSCSLQCTVLAYLPQVPPNLHCLSKATLGFQPYVRTACPESEQLHSRALLRISIITVRCEKMFCLRESLRDGKSLSFDSLLVPGGKKNFYLTFLSPLFASSLSLSRTLGNF